MRTEAALAADQPGGTALVRSVQTRFNLNATAGEGGTHVATVSANLLGDEIRATTLDEITDRWQAAGDALLAEVAACGGVCNATHGLRPGPSELRLRLKEGAVALRLTAADVAGQVCAAEGMDLARTDWDTPPEKRSR
ncbi:hypothetical protein [Rhodovulum euryhalinum]|uniref:Uncharacterized protein n=1 Tax=Rhodovulum euryhalinum TaxID=35805 RepID=A0A4R2KLH9_9RHOB|nr:hypothetical protein [Rhodovulum euryhalinum]TCO71569.1 hypothetical protein EV655_10661 [Rhodovulum euryhalinum]